MKRDVKRQYLISIDCVMLCCDAYLHSPVCGIDDFPNALNEFPDPMPSSSYLVSSLLHSSLRFF